MYAHVRVKVLENICIICICFCCPGMTDDGYDGLNHKIYAYVGYYIMRVYIRMYAGGYFRKHPSYPSSVIESNRTIAISIVECKSIYNFSASAKYFPIIHTPRRISQTGTWSVESPLILEALSSPPSSVLSHAVSPSTARADANNKIFFIVKINMNWFGTIPDYKKQQSYKTTSNKSFANLKCGHRNESLNKCSCLQFIFHYSWQWFIPEFA